MYYHPTNTLENLKKNLRSGLFSYNNYLEVKKGIPREAWEVKSEILMNL